MTYNEAIEYIHGINWTFCKPGLERISELCEKLGHPERKLKFIHVAGTNGKGSVCSMTESVLRAAGYKTGLYTSPYIRQFNERMQINGKNISNEELVELAEYVRPFADAMTDKPTEFELITAVAFEYFARNNCDAVVLEAGLGGRLDSTNVIRNPLLSVITGIALDHTAILGDTIEKIASEKAGIIKDAAPILFGGENETAAEVIKAQAKISGSVFYQVNYDSLSNVNANLSGTVFDYGTRHGVEIKLLGLYQPKNAAIVINIVDILNKYGFRISDTALYEGLKKAIWPARFEKVADDPLIIFDGAHNPQGIEQAVKSIRHYFGNKKIHILTGVLKDKNYNEIAKMLATVTDRAFTITPPSPRALPADNYAEVLRQAGINATAFTNIAESFSTAKKEAKNDKVPLVCLGSLYVYASLSQLF